MTRDDIIKAAFRHRDGLLSHAFALLRDWAVAEDVVQDAYIVVMNKWSEFRPGTSVFLWVRQIVHLKSLEALRSRARRFSLVEEELLDQVASCVRDHLGEEAAERQRLRREALQRCMAGLSERCLRLLSGFYADARSCEAIGEEQNRSANAVRLALSRLRRQLQDCVARLLPILEANA